MHHCVRDDRVDAGHFFLVCLILTPLQTRPIHVYIYIYIYMGKNADLCYTYICVGVTLIEPASMCEETSKYPNVIIVTGDIK